jgi:hypothetical protein
VFISKFTDFFLAFLEGVLGEGCGSNDVIVIFSVGEVRNKANGQRIMMRSIPGASNGEVSMVTDFRGLCMGVDDTEPDSLGFTLESRFMPDKSLLSSPTNTIDFFRALPAPKPVELRARFIMSRGLSRPSWFLESIS